MRSVQEDYVKKPLIEAIIGLALDPTDQVKAHYPTCPMCGILDDFDGAMLMYEDTHCLSDDQEHQLLLLNAFLDQHDWRHDNETGTNEEILRQAKWSELRQEARKCLQICGWELKPLPEWKVIKPGNPSVWQRDQE